MRRLVPIRALAICLLGAAGLLPLAQAGEVLPLAPQAVTPRVFFTRALVERQRLSVDVPGAEAAGDLQAWLWHPASGVQVELRLWDDPTDRPSFEVWPSELQAGSYDLRLLLGDSRFVIPAAVWVLGPARVTGAADVELRQGGVLDGSQRYQVRVPGLSPRMLSVTIGSEQAFSRIDDVAEVLEFVVPAELAAGRAELRIEAVLPPDLLRLPVHKEWFVQVVRDAEAAPGPDLRELPVLEYPQGASPGALALRLGDEEFRFVRVPTGVYWMGLTKEQAADAFLAEMRLAPASSSYGGAFEVPLVHPFFLQETEVTNGQYWAWLRAAGRGEGRPPLPAHLAAYGPPTGSLPLPPEIASQPVRNVSHTEAAAFARWLDDAVRRIASRWHVRLPQEVEWEMAARGDRRRYAFTDRLAARAVEPLVAAKTVAPVRSQAFDRSWVGVADMTANVGEWTNTPFDEDFLDRLRLSVRSGRLEGWDPRPGALDSSDLVAPVPRDPAASVNLCVRGGANGERRELLQVSVRRQWERNGRHAAIGFRLLIVCEDGP